MPVYLKGYLLFWLVCVGNGFAAYAQQPVKATDCRYTLHGRITDGDHAEELPGATVFIKELQTGASSDLHGEYSIKGLCPGRYTLICQFVGFESREMPVTITGHTTLDFKLYHKTTNLETVMVIAQAERKAAALVTEEKSGRELDEVKGGNLADALRSLSGVSTIQTGPTISKPVIRGLHSQRILTLNNGVRQEGQQWGTEHAPEIDPFAAGRISVVKGAASVRYGPDAVAGVILVEAPELRQSPGVGGHVYGLGISNGRQGVLAVQLDGKPENLQQLSWRLQGSVKKAGDLRAPDYFLTNTGQEELNGSAALGWTTARTQTEALFSSFNTRLGIYAGAHIGNLTDLQQVLASGQPLVNQPFRYQIKPPYQQVQHHTLSLKHSHTKANLGRLVLQYGWQQNVRQEFDLQRGDNPNQDLPPDFDLRLQTHTTELLLEHKAIGPFKGTVGLSTLTQTNRIGGRRFLIPDFDVYSGGLFLIEQVALGDFLVEAGARTDFRRQRIYGQRANSTLLLAPVDLDFLRFSGSAGFTYSRGHHWSYQFNLGTAWRAPSINELYSNGVHHGAAAFEIGNPNLKQETVYSVTAGINYTGPMLELAFQPYAQVFSGFVYARPLPDPVLTIRGAFPAFAFSQTDALFLGTDITAQIQISRNWQLHTTAAYVQAKNLELNQHLPLIPPARFGNKLEFSLPSKGKITDATVAFGHQTVARQSRYTEGSDFVSPPSAYTLVNAEAGATFLIREKPVWLQLSATNLLNTRYRDYLNRFRYFADETGRSFTLRVRIPLGKPTA